MRRGSIALRLFWTSLVWLVLALALTAFLLTDLYSRALDDQLATTLEFQIETLVGVSISTSSANLPPASLADQRFARPASGWYWQIRDADSKIASFSPSLIGTSLPQLTIPFDIDNLRTGILTDGFGTQIRLLERRINLDGKGLFIAVAGNLDDVFELVDRFRGQTLIVLGAVGLMLAAMSGIVARFALRPIGRLRQAVERVREGDAEQVEGDYPREIAPLAEEVNELLRSNSQIIERARSQVGNLAHGLKTPLAVLRNEAAGSRTGLARVVLSETEKMTNLVSAYLDRARLAARTAIVGRKADTGEVLTRLVRVMQKLNPDREILFESPENTTDLWFRGEAGDLEEMAGNLVDNACKWGRKTIRVSLGPQPSAGSLRILVEDDGKGLNADEREKVLRRGVRLDEKTPGSGLGLDIVKELVDIYGGTLRLETSALGGLMAELVLPSARRRRKRGERHGRTA